MKYFFRAFFHFVSIIPWLIGFVIYDMVQVWKQKNKK